MYLPETYEKKLKSLLGEEYDAYLSGFDRAYGQTLRWNPLKKMPAEFLRRFAMQPVPWCETGYYYEGEERLSMHPYYYGGVYYLQEPCAMAPASFLPVRPGDRVLDLCAAPGGKTTALAGKLQGEGVLIANDISISRCKALLKNMELAGVRNAMILCEEPSKLEKPFQGYFDSILVDAPCSGEGMFRKDGSMAADWSPEAVEKYSRIQKELVSRAAKMLRPGGHLLYSTCTYSPEENEQVVETLLTRGFVLKELPSFSGVDSGHPEWSVTGDEQLKHCRRFWNHRVQGEGQFAALLQKTGEESGSLEQRQNGEIPRSNKRKKTSPALRDTKSGATEEMRDFLRSCSMELPEKRLQFLEERAFLLPEALPDMRGIRIVRSGLYLGDCKKKRFEPSQALAHALSLDHFQNVLRLSVEDERVEKYLRCETIEAEGKDGWVLVCVDEYPLGWGKRSRGILKNKFHPGWRKQ